MIKDFATWGVPTIDLEFMAKYGYLPEEDDKRWKNFLKKSGEDTDLLPHDENEYLNDKWHIKAQRQKIPQFSPKGALSF